MNNKRETGLFPSNNLTINEVSPNREALQDYQNIVCHIEEAYQKLQQINTEMLTKLDEVHDLTDRQVQNYITENNRLRATIYELECVKNELDNEKQQLIEKMDKAQIDQELLKNTIDNLENERNLYSEKYVQAVNSFKHEKKRSVQLTSENIKLRNNLKVVEASKAWKLVKLYWRFRKEFIKGNNQQKRKFIQDVLRLVNRKRQLVVSFDEKKFVDGLDTYLKQVSNSDSNHVLVMFSGTTYVQEHKGNRPIRITNELLANSVPVFFSYWRWNRNDQLPNHPNPMLFQSPIDLTMKYINKVINYDFKDKTKIFVVSFPHLFCARIINSLHLHGWTVIYDVRDEWEEFQKVGQAKWFNKDIEKYIVNNSDVVCTVSKPLRDKIQTYTDKQIQLSPNALDSNFLTNGKVSKAQYDGKPVIGYVGHLTDAWFNWDAILQIADQEPTWRFEIIGHSMPDHIKLPANIHYLGPKNHQEIKRIAKKWRVAIIPFTISTLSDGVDPIKVYEYLAMGLPVVSFRMPQIHDYPYVHIAHSIQEFKEQIRIALKVPVNLNIIEEFLKQNRWENRAQQFIQWGEQYKKNPNNIIKNVGKGLR